jgi:hypothetical protein
MIIRRIDHYAAKKSLAKSRETDNFGRETASGNVVRLKRLCDILLHSRLRKKSIHGPVDDRIAEYMK